MRAVQVESISFAYPGRPGRAVFRDYSAEFDPGVHILRGYSGCGKSTLLRLIAGYLSPDVGVIRLPGGVSPADRAYQIASLGFVFQSINLLDGLNLRQNVEMAGSLAGLPHDELAQAAQRWLEIMGISNLAGEKPNRLSGGQRQRICIARAVLKDPAILILDEATPALDTESEKTVQDALSRLMKGRTTLVIAHRLSTIREADEIIVMHEGRIIERGHHNDLVEIEEGVYKKLTRMQQIA